MYLITSGKYFLWGSAMVCRSSASRVTSLTDGIELRQPMVSTNPAFTVLHVNIAKSHWQRILLWRYNGSGINLRGLQTLVRLSLWCIRKQIATCFRDFFFFLHFIIFTANFYPLCPLTISMTIWSSYSYYTWGRCCRLAFSTPDLTPYCFLFCAIEARE